MSRFLAYSSDCYLEYYTVLYVENFFLHLAASTVTMANSCSIGIGGPSSAPWVTVPEPCRLEYAGTACGFPLAVVICIGVTQPLETQYLEEGMCPPKMGEAGSPYLVILS